MSGTVKATSTASADRESQQAAEHRNDLDRLMTVEEVADYLNVPVSTIYQWRHKGTGPRAFRVGRFLRYDPSDIRAWLHQHAETSHGLD